MRRGCTFAVRAAATAAPGAPGFVWVSDEELAALADFRVEALDEVRERYTRLAHRGRTLREKGNGDCVFYDRDSGCTIYPVRPRQCRTWPFWDSNVADAEAWKRTCDVCPGAGSGDLIPADEILRRIKVICL